jgi:hypothetical protein
MKKRKSYWGNLTTRDMVYGLESLWKIYCCRNCCPTPMLGWGKYSVIFWHPMTLLSYLHLCQHTLSCINCNVYFKKPSDLFHHFRFAYLHGLCLTAAYEIYSLCTFLHEPCFSFAQLQCLAWIHLTQDISTKNGHSGNITKHSPKDLKWYYLCYISLSSLLITNMWCYQNQPNYKHQLIVFQFKSDTVQT